VPCSCTIHHCWKSFSRLRCRQSRRPHQAFFLDIFIATNIVVYGGRCFLVNYPPAKRPWGNSTAPGHLSLYHHLGLGFPSHSSGGFSMPILNPSPSIRSSYRSFHNPQLCHLPPVSARRSISISHHGHCTPWTGVSGLISDSDSHWAASSRSTTTRCRSSAWTRTQANLVLRGKSSDYLKFTNSAQSYRII